MKKTIIILLSIISFYSNAQLTNTAFTLEPSAPTWKGQMNWTYQINPEDNFYVIPLAYFDTTRFAINCLDSEAVAITSGYRILSVDKFGSLRVINPTILSGSATLDFPNTSPTEYNVLTIPVTGASVGDPVSFSSSDAILSDPDALYFSWVSSADTVSIRIRNLNPLSGASINPASAIFNVKVFK